MFKKRKQHIEEQAEWDMNLIVNLENLKYQMEQFAKVLGYEWKRHSEEERDEMGPITRVSYTWVKIKKGKK